MSSLCHLIIDSCCDLPLSVCERPGVDLLSFTYSIDGVDHSDDLYQSSSAHEFFESMRQGACPQTSQLSLPLLLSVFTQAAEEGTPTVYLGFSSALSGTFDLAQMAADQVRAQYPDFELYLVDSKLASAAEALLVYEALNQRDAGLSARELADWANEARYFIHALFMLDDFEALKRGGRIPKSVALAGSKLDVKPLLSFDLDGNLSLAGLARGRKKGLRQLVEFYTKHADQTELNRSVVLADADCPKDMARLQELLQKEDNSLLFLNCQVGPVIGAHVGPGMIALVFWGADRRQDVSVADRIARKVKQGSAAYA